ncbi:MAG: hypothetical protein WD426_16475 [Anditalea sp.]
MRKEQRDMSDKELDDFFSKMTGNPDIPYNPADWSKMKAKLDHHATTGIVNGSRPWYKGWFIPLVAFMIFTGIGLGWKYMGDKSGKTEDILSTAHSTVELDLKKMEKKKLITMDSGENNGENNRSAKPEAKGTKKDEAIAIISKATDIKPTPTGVVNGGIRTSDFGGGKVNHGPSASEKTGYSMVDKIYSKIKKYKDQFAKSQVLGEMLPPSLIKSRNEQGSPIGPPPEVKQVTPSKKEKEKGDEYQFSIALLLAPDVSALKIKDIAGLGTSVGFNVEYFIHHNISLNTGALYAFKTYRGGEVDYKGYVPSPTGIRGDCYVLDLPLNIRYYVINRELDRWYISGGMSSYFMLREKYDLDYNNYRGEVYTKKVGVENRNRHYLGIVNLGLGYQRVLSQHLAIQVEPYLKLPIDGIGEGRINLKSAGALVGLKYNW